MDLSTELRKRLLIDCGIYVTEACDSCGTLLGPIRFTRIEDSGEWCSRECRGDGERRVIRRGGRPRKYRTRGQAHAAKMRLQRLRRKRSQ
jgi:hypothetical protein